MSLSAMGAVTLIVLCVAWLSVAFALSWHLIRRTPQSLAFRWTGTGLLVMLSGGVFSQFAHNHKWPNAQLVAVDAWTLAVGLVGVGCLIVSVVIRLRPQHSSGTAPRGSR